VDETIQKWLDQSRFPESVRTRLAAELAAAPEADALRAIIVGATMERTKAIHELSVSLNALRRRGLPAARVMHYAVQLYEVCDDPEAVGAIRAAAEEETARHGTDK
jgi:hypothetical protein